MKYSANSVWENKDEYDVAVIGAGHAGCEAALAAARLGFRTVMFTVSVDSIALMPCNPNIGGTYKGHLVREIDALGGEMGKVIDRTFIQSKMLNKSKGPAVHSLRAQRVYCRSFGLIEHLRLDKCSVYHFSHFPSKGVYFSDKMSLVSSSDIRIARHKRDTVHAHCKHDSPKSESCGCKSCLASCMPRSYYRYIIFVFIFPYRIC